MVKSEMQLTNALHPPSAAGSDAHSHSHSAVTAHIAVPSHASSSQPAAPFYASHSHPASAPFSCTDTVFHFAFADIEHSSFTVTFSHTVCHNANCPLLDDKKTATLTVRPFMGGNINKGRKARWGKTAKFSGDGDRARILFESGLGIEISSTYADSFKGKTTIEATIAKSTLTDRLTSAGKGKAAQLMHVYASKAGNGVELLKQERSTSDPITYSVRMWQPVVQHDGKEAKAGSQCSMLLTVSCDQLEPFRKQEVLPALDLIFAVPLCRFTGSKTQAKTANYDVY